MSVRKQISLHGCSEGSAYPRPGPSGAGRVVSIPSPPLSPALPPRRYYRPTDGPRDVRTPIASSCRGLSWRPTCDPGVLATVPVWSGAGSWLDALAAALRTPQGDAQRRTARVRVETVLDVAAVDARAADSRTGRGVATAHATVARQLGCAPKTIQRARRLIEALGYAVTVLTGRYLTTQERAVAKDQHGGDQRRMASERTLTIPQATTHVHLPRRGQVHNQGFSRSGLPTRAQGRAGAAPRPARTRKPQRQADRPPLPVQRLAAGLAQRMPWLARGHIGALCRTLGTLGLDDIGWTPADVITMLDRRNVDLGVYSIDARAQTAPLALFAHQARAALANQPVEPPRQRRQRAADALTADRARRSAERAADDERYQAELADPAAQARIADAKAAIRAHLDGRSANKQAAAAAGAMAQHITL